MFCGKCGSKLLDNEETCRICGAEHVIVDRCGGFFGLIKQQPANQLDEHVGAAADPEIYYRQRKDEEDEAMRKKALIAASVVCVILLIVVVVQAFMMRAITEEQNSIGDTVKTMNDWIQDNADHDEDGMCDVCKQCLHGEDKVKHTVQISEGTHSNVCECGAVLKVDACIDDNLEDGMSICASCGKEISCDHQKSKKTYTHCDENPGHHDEKCANCGEVTAEGIECKYEEHETACTSCNEECEHVWVQDANSEEHAEVCDICDAINPELEFVDESADLVCDICGWSET